MNARSAFKIAALKQMRKAAEEYGYSQIRKYSEVSRELEESGQDISLAEGLIKGQEDALIDLFDAIDTLIKKIKST